MIAAATFRQVDLTTTEPRPSRRAKAGSSISICRSIAASRRRSCWLSIATSRSDSPIPSAGSRQLVINPRTDHCPHREVRGSFRWPGCKKGSVVARNG